MSEISYEARAITAVAAHLAGKDQTTRAELDTMTVPELRALSQKLVALTSLAAQTIVAMRVAGKTTTENAIALSEAMASVEPPEWVNDR